jgi:hypothetical protein
VLETLEDPLRGTRGSELSLDVRTGAHVTCCDLCTLPELGPGEVERLRESKVPIAPAPRAAPEEILMMRPHCLARIIGNTACVHRKTDFRLSAIV